MNPAMPDAAPLTPSFLESLSEFLENQHGGPGRGDISKEVKEVIAQQSLNTAQAAEVIGQPDSASS